MTTWTPAAKQNETWGLVEIAVFSRAVFSHAHYAGKRVFSIGPIAAAWNVQSKQDEIWTAV